MINTITTAEDVRITSRHLAADVVREIGEAHTRIAEMHQQLARHMDDDTQPLLAEEPRP